MLTLGSSLAVNSMNESLEKVVFPQVGLVLSIPVLYQEENVDLQPSAISTVYNQLHLVHLVTMAHIVQVLLSSQGKKNHTHMIK